MSTHINKYGSASLQYYDLFCFCEPEVLIHLTLAVPEGLLHWLTQILPFHCAFEYVLANTDITTCWAIIGLSHLHLNWGKPCMGSLGKWNIYSTCLTEAKNVIRERGLGQREVRENRRKERTESGEIIKLAAKSLISNKQKTYLRSSL